MNPSVVETEIPVAPEQADVVIPKRQGIGGGLHRIGRWVRNPWLIGPIGLIVVASWLSAYSAWTDSVQVSSTSSAGSIDLTAGGLDGVLNLAGLNLSNVLPGASGYASTVIRNAGTSDVVYGMGSSSSAPSNPLNTVLASALQMGVTVIPSGQTCDSAHYNSSSDVLQPLTTGLNNSSVFSNRPLAAGSSETLCFKQVLPLSAASSLMSAVTNTVFTFTASSPT